MTRDRSARFFDLADSFKRQAQSIAARKELLNKITKGASDGGDRTDPAQDRPGADAGDGAGAGAQPAAGQGATTGLTVASGGYVGPLSGAVYSPPQWVIQAMTQQLLPPVYQPVWPSTRSNTTPCWCGNPGCTVAGPSRPDVVGDGREEQVELPTLPYGGEFEFAVGEIYAIRRWYVGGGGLLLSAGLRGPEVPPWRRGVNRARCYAQQCFTFPQRGLIDPTGRGRRAVQVDTSFAMRSDYGLIEITWEDGGRGRYNMKGIKTGPVPPHDVPDEFCTCGFYAFSSADYLPDYAEAPVVGVVKLSGRVLEGTRGYRAQKAEIVAIARKAPTHRTLFRTAQPGAGQINDVQAAYGVPVLRDLDALLDYAPLTKLDDESPSS